MFGLESETYKAEPQSFWNTSHSGVPVFDPYFDPSPKENQLNLRDLCTHLETSKFIYNQNVDANCFIKEIEKEALDNGKAFPLEPHEFNETMKAKVGNEIDGKVRHFALSFNIVGIASKTFDEQLEIFYYYQKIVEDIRAKFPRGISTCF